MRRHLAEETTTHKNDDFNYGIATAGNPLYAAFLESLNAVKHRQPHYVVPLTREEEQGDA